MNGIGSPLWHGIPIYNARTAYFLDALQNVSTLRRLIVNNKELTFASQNDGYVKLDNSYLNWLFGCPLGAFTPADFEGKTVAAFFNTIINYTRTHTVKSWEEFATYIRQNGNLLDTVMGYVTSASITAPNMNGSITLSSVPTLTPPENFTALLTWIKSLIPNSMLSQDCSIMQVEIDGGSYSYGVTLELLVNVADINNPAMNFAFVI